MTLPLLLTLMLSSDCANRLSVKWHEFKRAHVVAEDPYDEQTRAWLESQEGEKHDDDVQ